MTSLGYALTAPGHDALALDDGLLLYVRDLASGDFWSAGVRPAPGASRRYEARATAGVFSIEREDDDIGLLLETCVPAGESCDLRRVTLTNRGTTVRSLELTTYAAVALDRVAAYTGHPVFSKLFVQTERDATSGALLARRRPRANGERHPWLVHVLLDTKASAWETDRARFLGRGRTPAAPLALTERSALSGTLGSVLDPAVSLRWKVQLQPQAQVTTAFLLGAAPDRLAALAMVARLNAQGAVARAFAAAPSATGPGALSIDPALLARVRPPAGPTAVEGNGVGLLTDAAGAAVRNDLSFDNGWGGFTADGREYVIRLRWEPGRGLRLPPRPWINVIANETFGCLVSENGAGYTWAGNSQQHRLTPWANDPVADPHGEAFWVRDEHSHAFWSVLPGPTPYPIDHEVRHGFGVTRFRHAAGGLLHEAAVFVAPRDPVKLVTLRLTNLGPRGRRLSLFSYQRLVLGVTPAQAQAIVTEPGATPTALRAHHPDAGDYAGRVAFAAMAGLPADARAHATCDRAAFLGSGGTPSAPAALHEAGALDGRTGSGLDPCFAQQATFELPAGATAQVTFLLGEAEGAAQADELVARYSRPGTAARALEEVRTFWTAGLSSVRITTPSPALDLMVNGWLAYQTLACRIWGRSAFYQSGGAYGFRDQLQDAAALVYQWPGITRAQILRNAAHQFVEGDVLHWWHPPASRGIRTRFADDLLWLPWLTAHYVATTGDETVLAEQVPYLTGALLDPGEDERFLEPQTSGERADVYAHCCRALDRSLGLGSHGLPLFGTGDWNDGMNRVGREGRGESVWMGFFLDKVLADFVPLCERRGDRARVRRYQSHRDALRLALNDGGWDGAWYRRGYYDDGTPLGSAAGDECRIDALAQAWSVISQAAPPARAAAALDAVEQQLVDQRHGLIRLLTPAFDRTPHDPGYIKGYVPGVRENGGQYTHAALWVVRALAELDRRDRAAALMDMLNPIHHARTTVEVDTYQVEPYVIAADVYGQPPHVGRGGWTWYTGSAGWMIRVAIESVLGLRVEEGRTLVLRPRVPDAWPGFTLAWRIPGERTLYEIHAVTPDGCARDVVRATLDGRPAGTEHGACRVPLVHDGRTHRVELVLGDGGAAAR